MIQPSGATIAAHVKLTELSPAGIATLREKENSKYEDFPYKPTGAPETRKQNCAGLVMETLFPGVQQGNIDPDTFFRKIVQPYGKEVTVRKKGDVVVYLDANGVVHHVAIVESAPVLGATTILTKDGDERPYIGTVPNRVSLYTDDPLFRAHAGPGGRIEFWRIDRSKVKIEQVSPGQCEQDRDCDQVLLNAVVKRALDPAQLGVGRGKESRPRLRQLVGRAQAVKDSGPIRWQLLSDKPCSTRATMALMAREITQRELRNQSGEVMRALDRGESFVVTRNGVPVGELTPVRERQFVAAQALVEVFADAPFIDPAQFASDIDAVIDQRPNPRA